MLGTGRPTERASRRCAFSSPAPGGARDCAQPGQVEEAVLALGRRDAVHATTGVQQRLPVCGPQGYQGSRRAGRRCVATGSARRSGRGDAGCRAGRRATTSCRERVPGPAAQTRGSRQRGDEGRRAHTAWRDAVVRRGSRGRQVVTLAVCGPQDRATGRAGPWPWFLLVRHPHPLLRRERTVRRGQATERTSSARADAVQTTRTPARNASRWMRSRTARADEHPDHDAGCQDQRHLPGLAAERAGDAEPAQAEQHADEEEDGQGRTASPAAPHAGTAGRSRARRWRSPYPSRPRRSPRPREWRG